MTAARSTTGVLELLVHASIIQSASITPCSTFFGGTAAEQKGSAKQSDVSQRPFGVMVPFFKSRLKRASNKSGALSGLGPNDGARVYGDCCG